MRPIRFADRVSAGVELGDRVRGLALDDPVVLAIPRAGVVVARSVSSALGAPLDVLDLHQVTAHRADLSIGTVSSTGEDLHPSAARALGVSPDELRDLAAGGRRELAELMARVRSVQEPVGVAGRPAVVVDDGLRVGSVTAAAAERLRRAGATRRVLAVPVGSSLLIDALRGVFDDVIVLEAAGPRYELHEWYGDAHRVTPDEVVESLAAAVA